MSDRAVHTAWPIVSASFGQGIGAHDGCSLTSCQKIVAPEDELRKMTRNAWVFIAVYGVVGMAVALGIDWLLWSLVLPRLLGAPVMLLFTLIQHVEMAENATSIVDSTRSFRTGRLGRFLYMNMNNHVEHHLYPQVPFFALPELREAIASRVPAPDSGLLRTNWEVFTVVLRRSLGLSTRAATARVRIQPLRHHSSSARASPQWPTVIRRSLLPASQPSRTARSSPSAMRRQQLFNVHSGHGPQVLDPAQVLPQVERQRQPQVWYLKQSVSAGVEAAPKGRRYRRAEQMCVNFGLWGRLDCLAIRWRGSGR